MIWIVHTNRYDLHAYIIRLLLMTTTHPIQPKKPVVYIGSQELAKVQFHFACLVKWHGLIRKGQISSLLPSNKNRSMIVHSLISSLGLMSSDSSQTRRRLQVVTPRKATYKDLAMYHTRDYLEVVLDAKSNSDVTLDARGQSVDAEFGLSDVITICSNSDAWIRLHWTIASYPLCCLGLSHVCGTGWLCSPHRWRDAYGGDSITAGPDGYCHMLGRRTVGVAFCLPSCASTIIFPSLSDTMHESLTHLVSAM